MTWGDSKDGSCDGDQSPLRGELQGNRLGLVPPAGEKAER